MNRCAVRCRRGRGGSHHLGRLLDLVLINMHARCRGDLSIAQAFQIAGHLPGGLITIRRVLRHCGKHHRINVDALGGG